jgi:DNA-binding Lrp family transcriptional regulator
MDKIDLEILYHLDMDARLPVKRIASVMGEKSERINYRLNKLFREGVIKRCYAEVNPWKIGYSSYKVYLQLQGVDEEKIDEMYEFLQKSCNISWAASCLGRWDMMVEILARDRYEFSEIYSRFHNKYCRYILSKVVSVTLELTFTNKKWLAEKDPKVSLSLMTGRPETLVDSKDRKILRHLINNGRDPMRKMAKVLGIPQTTVSQRVSRMARNGIIGKFRADIDLSKFNRIYCKSFVYLSAAAPEDEKKFIDHCVNHPDVVFFNKSIAPWDVEIEAHAPSFNDFTDMMSDMRNRYPGVVRNFEAVVINKGTGSFHTIPPEE